MADGAANKSVVLVTGSSRGLGLAIARRFLDEGSIVSITGTVEAS